MSAYKCAVDGCYAHVEERGEECGGHDERDYPQVVIPEHIETKETDRRGRLTLGKEFGDKRLTVAVIKSEDTMKGCDICETMKPADEVEKVKEQGGRHEPDGYVSVCAECRGN